MAAKKGKGLLTGGWRAFLIGLAIVFGMIALHRHYSGGFASAELGAYDFRMNLRGKIPQTGKVAIVAIDDQSLADPQLGRWPWPRNVMARLIDAIAYYKPAVVGLDLIFPERDELDVEREKIAARLRTTGLSDELIREKLGTGNDEALASAIKRQGSTYIAYPFPDFYKTGNKITKIPLGYISTLREPPPLQYNLVRSSGPSPELLAADVYLPPNEIINSAARGTAHVSVDHDLDGELRDELMVIRFQDRYSIPLALELVSAYRDHAPLYLEINQFGVSRLAVGDEDVAVDDLGRMLVNFRGPVNTFTPYSASDVINHRLASSALAGKIVLVGVTGIGLGDRVSTPVGSDFPGVEVHANAIDNILLGDFIRRTKATEAEQLLAAVVLGLVISFVVAHTTAPFAFAAFVMMGAGYVGYVHYRLVSQGDVINVVFPLMTLGAVYLFVASYRYLTEGLEKRRLRHVFEHYLNPDVIASVVDDPEGLKLGGSRRHLSILFADIVGFTSRAERAESPEALIAELNVYFTRMLALILDSGGVVDKLIGDAIMAFWGAPAEIQNPARHAIDTALNMLAELDKLRKEDQRFADFDIGVGIATGEPVVGNLGGETRFDYSVIGDSVNFASRLEGLTRKFGPHEKPPRYIPVHLLVSENTFDEAGPSNYIARKIGLVIVKGKDVPLPIIEVVGRASDGVDPTFYSRFASVRELIGNSEHRRAVDELLELKAMRLKELGKEDHLIDMYLETLNHYLANGAAEPLTEMIFEFESK